MSVKKEPIKVIYTPKKNVTEEITVPFYEIKPEKIINYSSIFYGPSETGKSFLINDIMYTFKHYFPTVFVFCPTNMEKHDYDKTIPYALIYEEVTLDKIKDIYERARASASIYNNANELSILYKLFKLVCTQKSMEHYKTIKATQSKAISDIKKNFKNPAEVSKNIDLVNEMANEQIRIHFKSVIRPNKNSLLRNRTLGEKEALALRYLDFNPHILVIFDDAMTEVEQIIKEGKKRNDPVIDNFFFKGRHAKITHFYAFQGDKVPPDIRKNAFNSFFTHKSSAIHFFNSGANSFSATEKKRASVVIDEVFDDGKHNKYNKLVWARTQKDQLQYIVAQPRGEFSMCSNTVRSYCDMLKKSDNEIDNSNPYMGTFMQYAR